ncbi:DUF3575 domain-containing protein [Bacteroides stercoris]|jgi:hypothetical protein|uniref:DUF3575 domain-containing protein n=1 Tax=Bacteroides stercoris TaxID=46506 RepID=A0A414KT05_BACSE|nr:DUF3575 domain-containing protein [Bacteroides stercoris]KAB5261803.1 DUF3575 domain-containing protein [Bacteroides stercoris]KAB5262084.1 DUF3575 domain-containing protein [Bacteroides stercoris]KAB5281042.1 DUF3575 domain-containing protein [Bacteroides stercoris]KAB5284447.1 DUF3575 domain-containing protein [Bacteroides stercoris]KAB5289241.1 DUF3575 domain-containing protein [Bacteroides stercoris]
MMKRNIGIILLAAIFCGTTARAYAQTEKDNTTTMPAKDRWAFETNAADWLFLAPNVGVEFDLSNSINNRWVIGANIKWNGNAKVKMDDRIQMGINDYRLEVKRYAKPTFNIQYGQARIPKFWRTYYWGFYAGYSKFTGIWGKGAAGDMFHLGLTGGWQLPVYKCKHGAIDLDLGLSVGAAYAKYDKFKYEGNHLVYTKSRDRHVLPYPVLTDLRVGFVYRFNSIRNKYSHRQK